MAVGNWSCCPQQVFVTLDPQGDEYEAASIVSVKDGSESYEVDLQVRGMLPPPERMSFFSFC